MHVALDSPGPAGVLASDDRYPVAAAPQPCFHAPEGIGRLCDWGRAGCQADGVLHFGQTLSPGKSFCPHFVQKLGVMLRPGLDVSVMAGNLCGSFFPPRPHLINKIPGLAITASMIICRKPLPSKSACTNSTNPKTAPKPLRMTQRRIQLPTLMHEWLHLVSQSSLMETARIDRYGDTGPNRCQRGIMRLPGSGN